MSDPTANAAQIEYWNDVSGPRWVAAQERLDPMIEGLGLRVMEACAVAQGERVVDVGCGCGATSLALAERVGVDGAVLGVDVSGPMLARARERARQAGYAQLDFVQADAQLHPFAGDADLVFSRFGVMFFEDPVAAFANLRNAMRVGGRLAFVCWQSLAANPWMALPMQVVSAFVEPRPPPEPGAPGPFSLADADRLRKILGAAGFDEIEIESFAFVQRMGASVDHALGFLLEGVGAVASSLENADAAAREGASRALVELLGRHETPRGIEIDSAAWVVQAR